MAAGKATTNLRVLDLESKPFEESFGGETVVFKVALRPDVVGTGQEEKSSGESGDLVPRQYLGELVHSHAGKSNVPACKQESRRCYSYYPRAVFVFCACP